MLTTCKCKSLCTTKVDSCKRLLFPGSNALRRTRDAFQLWPFNLVKPIKRSHYNLYRCDQALLLQEVRLKPRWWEKAPNLQEQL